MCQSANVHVLLRLSNLQGVIIQDIILWGGHDVLRGPKLCFFYIHRIGYRLTHIHKVYGGRKGKFRSISLYTMKSALLCHCCTIKEVESGEEKKENV